MEAREFLLRNRENEQKLRKFVDLIWPFFQKMAILYKRSLQFFNDEYRWSMRNYQEGTSSSLTKAEIIESDIELVKLNGIDNYCKFSFSSATNQRKKEEPTKRKKICYVKLDYYLLKYSIVLFEFIDFCLKLSLDLDF